MSPAKTFEVGTAMKRWLFNVLRPFVVNNIDPNEDFACIDRGAPVLRRVLRCSGCSLSREEAVKIGKSNAYAQSSQQVADEGRNARQKEPTHSHPRTTPHFQDERSVHKYRLIGPRIEMPRGAKVLSVQVQHDEPVIYALVDPHAPKVMHAFGTVLTGKVVTAELVAKTTYVGTCMLRGGTFVVHIYDAGEESVG